MNPNDLEQLSKGIYDDIINCDLFFPTTDKAIDELLNKVNKDDLKVDFTDEIKAHINGEIIEQQEENEKVIKFPSMLKNVAGFYRNKHELSENTEKKLEKLRKNIIEGLNK